MKIAIEGCCHGDLDKIYATLTYAEKKNNFKIDLLICCGDFQAIRNIADMRCTNIKKKYMHHRQDDNAIGGGDFRDYFLGKKKAPMLTIFIGGNHEASNHLLSLYYGGWVAPNIYYLGHGGVVNFNGITIGGISGIYKHYHYDNGYFERFPLNDSDIRSTYHVRHFEVDKFKLYHQLRQKAQLSKDEHSSLPQMDIMLSHEWPCGISKYGDEKGLIRRKAHFRPDIESTGLGAPPFMDLLKTLQPKFWFSSHLHCKFAAEMKHGDTHSTRFLALDKCLPHRQFLQILDLPSTSTDMTKNALYYDPIWLAIVKSTHNFLSFDRVAPPNLLKSLNDDKLSQSLSDIFDVLVPQSASSTDPSTFYFDDAFKIPLPSFSNVHDIAEQQVASFSPDDQTVQFLNKLQLSVNVFDALSQPPQHNNNNKNHGGQPTHPPTHSSEPSNPDEIPLDF